MFTELMPILADRPVTITVSKLKGDSPRIRVNIIPKSVEFKNPASAHNDEKDQHKKLEKAAEGLNTPLSVEGTPEEIDAELAKVLGTYVENLQGLKTTLDESVKEIEEAKRAAEEAKKAKSDKAKDASKKATETKKANATKPQAHTTKTTGEGTTKPPATFGLFNAADEANASVERDDVTPPPAEDLPEQAAAGGE